MKFVRGPPGSKGVTSSQACPLFIRLFLQHSHLKPGLAYRTHCQFLETYRPSLLSTSTCSGASLTHMATFATCPDLHRHPSTRHAGLAAISFCAKDNVNDELHGVPPATSFIFGQSQFLKAGHGLQYIDIREHYPTLFSVSHTLCLFGFQ